MVSYIQKVSRHHKESRIDKLSGRSSTLSAADVLTSRLPCAGFLNSWRAPVGTTGRLSSVHCGIFGQPVITVLFDGNAGTSIIRYSDSDYAGCTAHGKSTSGYVFLLAGGAVGWKSKKQSVIATSCFEAECLASCMDAKEAIWLLRLESDLHQKSKPDIVPIRVDNNGLRDLALTATINERTKHIDVQYHFVRQCCQERKFKLERCHTADQVADPMTKPLEKQSHEKFCIMQGLCSQQMFRTAAFEENC